MIRILVSSCLLGERVRYHGGHSQSDSELVRKWQDEGRVVPFCPEIAGGFGVPRLPAEIQRGDGHDVASGVARVVDRDGNDVTAGFRSGADAAVAVALRHGARLAILKDGSPSCGSAHIYDGTFAGAVRRGAGVTAVALTRAGVRVFAEHEIPAAARWLAELESAGDPSSANDGDME